MSNEAWFCCFLLLMFSIINIKSAFNLQCRTMTTPLRKHLERMAQAGYHTMFEERWSDLHPKSIERALWLNVAEAMVRSFDFPQDFLKLHRELFMEIKP